MKNINPSIVAAKFTRSQLKLKKTKLWTMIDPNQKELMLKELKLLQDEKEILTYYNDSYWWLITNMNLIIYDTNLTYIELSKISEITLMPNIKFIDSAEALIEIAYEDKRTVLYLEKLSWTVIIEIFRFITTADIEIK